MPGLGYTRYNFEEAIACYQKAIAADPNCAMVGTTPEFWLCQLSQMCGPAQVIS